MKKSFGNIIRFFALSAMVTGVSSCADSDLGEMLGWSSEDVINVGGIEMEEVQVATRAAAQEADKVDWLVAPLTNGLDITYGNIIVNSSNREEQKNQDVAILKLTNNTTTPATYTFNYRMDRVKHTTDNEPAIWHNNGTHYFQGVHVPDRIRYTTNIEEVEQEGHAPGLLIDQHDDESTGTDVQLGNYTLLAHYLGMPANTRITATISRIKLPFRHRLARVIAFVLIDPVLNTRLKGYTATVKDGEGKITSQDDPNTTSFRFCNVQVLQGVKDVLGSDGHHTLTPYWGRPRKVIPHFDGERGSYSYKENKELAPNFILYTKTDGNDEVTDVYPTSSNWAAIHAKTPDASGKKDGYTPVDYGKVPVYDIIVRPTYSDADHVMYDEELEGKTKTEFARATNYIDFEISLENGLNYEKRFEFDLDANYQTVVYLRIGREQVNYNDAGSEIWVETKNHDDWYGVDNENGNTLSMAGSSWQRAYRTKALPNTETDKVTDGDFYQSTAESVGQYLGSTDKWTKLLLQACEGGAHHGDYFVLDHDITINAQQIPKDFVFTGHLDAQDHVITLTGTNADTYETTTNYELYPTEKLYNKVDGNYVEFHMPTLYICEEVAQAKPARGAARIASETIPVGPDMMTLVTPTLAQVMTNDVVYYEKVGSDYRLWNPRSWTFYTHRISAGSLFCGLDGTYTTAQEEAANPYAEGFKWEANVHKETNMSTVWVPTLGYRAEVLNAVVAGGTLFPVELPHASVTGNVQNCFNKDSQDKKIAVTNTPNIPQYK